MELMGLFILILFTTTWIRFFIWSKFIFDIHDFIFNDPDVEIDVRKPTNEQEYSKRLRWEKTELPSDGQMFLMFWVWPLTNFMRGTSYEKQYLEWLNNGKPKKRPF